MARTNAFEARAMHTLTKSGTRTLRSMSIYPEVPAGWPSRVVRRAVKLGREFRLPKPWVGVLADPTMVPVMVNGMLDHVTRGALLRRHIRMM